MLQEYCVSLTGYHRLPVREVLVGDLALGHNHPIRIQTMTTTDTMDTAATVAQCVRCIEAGTDMLRITAPSKNEAENLGVIQSELRKRGYHTPIVADIHFTPNAAEVAARIIEKVRINPGNYIDKKRFDLIEYTDAEYAAEIDRIRSRFTPLVNICKEYGTAMRIGTNHGSLSDRIMSRYGDTPMGMVESAMEFLRIARNESYHNIVLSMKSSNPLVMVQAYRLLVLKMDEEFKECYPLHLGVTEAGDGEDGRIKSAIGIGTLLEDGLGDTIRVSLTEDPEFELPVCRDIVKRYAHRAEHAPIPPISKLDNQGRITLPYNPFHYVKRATKSIQNIGTEHVPVVIANWSKDKITDAQRLESIGYKYDALSDKWHISDGAADYLYCADNEVSIALPGTLRVIYNYAVWKNISNNSECYPLLTEGEFVTLAKPIPTLHFVAIDAESYNAATLLKANATNAVLVVHSSNKHAMPSMRRLMINLMEQNINCPVIIAVGSDLNTIDEQLIDFATDSGALLLDGFGNGLWLTNQPETLTNIHMSGRTYMDVGDNHTFINNTAFSILQATRTRISKTEYISCPSCGRTLFDLQETTAQIKLATQHLKGVKIAIMGCIVNGPGEMADADFGYVGSGPEKITLYKGKDVVKKNIPREIAVDELIKLLKENEAWVDVA